MRAVTSADHLNSHVLLTSTVDFAIFNLKETASPEGDLTTIYRGGVPFVLLQLHGLPIIFTWKSLATWVPVQGFGQVDCLGT